MLFHSILYVLFSLFFFFFNDTATTEIYTLSLHDALPISFLACFRAGGTYRACDDVGKAVGNLTRLGTRSEEHTSELQSVEISYAVFCLKKKKKKKTKMQHDKRTKCTQHTLHDRHTII